MSHAGAHTICASEFFSNTSYLAWLIIGKFFKGAPRKSEEAVTPETRIINFKTFEYGTCWLFQIKLEYEKL